MFFIFITLKEDKFIRLPLLSSFNTGKLETVRFDSIKLKATDFTIGDTFIDIIVDTSDDNTDYLMESLSIAISDIANYSIYISKEMLKEATNE